MLGRNGNGYGNGRRRAACAVAGPVPRFGRSGTMPGAARNGAGFGLRGAVPPAPYTGRGRGGLPRCAYYLKNTG
jgi:hypothetical protein